MTMIRTPHTPPDPIRGGSKMYCPMLRVVDDSYAGPPLELDQVRCHAAFGGPKALARYRAHWRRAHWRPFIAETEAIMAYRTRLPEPYGKHVHATIRIGRPGAELGDAPDWWPWGPDEDH